MGTDAIEKKETEIVAQELLFGLREGEEVLQRTIGKRKSFLRERWLELAMEVTKAAKVGDGLVISQSKIFKAPMNFFWSLF